MANLLMESKNKVNPEPQFPAFGLPEANADEGLVRWNMCPGRTGADESRFSFGANGETVEEREPLRAFIVRIAMCWTPAPSTSRQNLSRETAT